MSFLTKQTPEFLWRVTLGLWVPYWTIRDWDKPSFIMKILSLGNKQVEKLVALRDIPSVVCDNQGNQKVDVLMKVVALVPDCAFNMFRISKRLKQGLKLCTIQRP